MNRAREPKRFQPSPNPLGGLKGSLVSSENKILLLIILVISVSFLLMAFILYSRYQSNLEDNYNKFGSLVASVVSVGGVERMQSSLSPELRVKSFVDDMLTATDDLASIEFRDNNGRIIYKNTKRLSQAELQQAIIFSAPLKIIDNGEPTKVLGEVQVKLTGKTMREVLSSTRNILLLVFISAWLLTIMAVSMNTYILSKHLRTLVQGVQRLATGDFGYRISDHDLWGELKHLAQSFNTMSAKLRAYEDQNLETITFERNKMEGVLLSIADGVIVCDENGEVIIINDSACELLTVKSHDLLIGTNIRDYIAVDGEKCFEKVIDDFRRICREHHNNLPQAFIRQVETPEKTFRVMISLIRDMEGDNLGFVMTAHDVTKEAEVDKLKTAFISNVSHELRTPVTTIKSYVDTIFQHGEELDKETYREFIETIHLETDRLKKLVNDILDFSRLNEGGFKLETEMQDITPIINLTVQSIKVLAQQKNLTVTTAIESNLPKVRINSDAIERVMRNLLSNAIKYTPESGRIKVKAELSAKGNALEVTVQDTGIGIPEEHISKIFDRFYRVENKVHTVKGTGLGLHLVKTTIEDHHQGEVFVTSEVGVGSSFGFRLHLSPVEDQVHLVGERPV